MVNRDAGRNQLGATRFQGALEQHPFGHVLELISIGEVAHSSAHVSAEE
jgi:hypothetical protein